MLQQQFTHTLKNPQLMDDEFTKNLYSIINEYPFFGTAQLLLTKALHQQNSLLYSKQLKKAAIVVNSCSVLYELIHKPNIKTNEVAFDEKTSEIKPAIVQQTVIVESEIKPEVNKNPITISNPDIKVIYINTVLNEPKNTLTNNTTVVKDELVVLPETLKDTELDLIKNIENESDKIDDDTLASQKTKHSLELEISKGIINSYVETDILKTNKLEKEIEKQPVSFTDWLTKVKKEAHTIQKPEIKKTITELKKEETVSLIDKPFIKTSQTEQKRQIIDKLIELDPGRIKFANTKFYNSSVDAKQGLLENEHLVTETLAKIYALQGNISKAIRAYEILSLKFPQKSVYFTTLIEKLKTNK